MQHRGLFLLPTRRRLDKLAAFFQAAKAAGMTSPGWVIVHADEYQELRAEYNAILPPDWELYPTPEDGGMAYKCQYVWQHSLILGDLEWVGILADDYRPGRPGWDKLLAERVNGWNIVAANDGWRAPKKITTCLLSTDLVRAIGYLAPPKLQHLYWDDMLETLGRDTGCVEFAMDVLVEHEHAMREIKPLDATTERVNSFYASDEKVFRDWLRFDRQGCVDRIVQLMRKKGVPMLDTDLTDVSLLITSLPGSGEYHHMFVKSLLRTILALRQYNAHVEFYDHPNCADLPFARACLFSGFVNSNFTHNLMTDADMSWDVLDVVRMLKLDLEFVAAAGPRKSDDQTYACSNTDEAGNVKPLYVRGDGLVEMSDVGGAFILVNRRFAQRMTDAYQDLKFRDAQGRWHHDLWLPITANGRHRSEDFSFCKRWRDIGGKIIVKPDVVLGHAGGKTWKGCFAEFLNEQMLERVEQQEQAVLQAAQ